MGFDPLSQASSALNLLTGLNSNNWNIQESSYGITKQSAVIFNIFKTPSLQASVSALATGAQNFNAGVDEVQDNWSRRVIPFEYPYIDGQTNDDLGRNGESFVFNILIYGQNYYPQYVALMKQFNSPLPGTLIHPVRGPMKVKPKEAVVTHKSDARQAVALKVTFVEHNFEASFTAPVQTTKSVLATAVGFISAIAGVVNSVQSITTVATSIAKSVISAVTGYQNSYTTTLVAMNTSFNSGSTVDLPSLLPNNPASTTFPSAESPNSPFAGVNQSQTNSAAAAQTPSQMIASVAAVRNQLTSLIEMMEGVSGGQGALIYYNQILTLKQSAQAMQQALVVALQSSTSQIVNYTVPKGKVMTVREICFANGISPDESEQVVQLNPTLLSVNYICGGTVVQVPTS
jgi:prophage DNA circulation protein